ncbi:MAG TPA: hypothetical protein VNT42_07600 [Sphingomonas sp.]|nr:hypothetical protein [Sphingomonas sp.]
MSGSIGRMVCARILASLAIAFPMACSAADVARPYRWESAPFGGGGFVDGFLYHPKVPGLLYARTDIGGMYRYDRDGRHWIPLLDHLGKADAELGGVLSMAVDPNDPDKLYAACGEYLGEWAHPGAVLRSRDRGASWQKTDLPFRLGANADGRGAGDRLQVDPNLGRLLFLGSNKDGLWKSANGGQTFAKVGGAPASVTFVLFDPRSGSRGSPSRTLWVGSADRQGGLFVSHDGGASFAAAPGAPRQTPQHAAFAPDGTLYVAFAEGDGEAPVNPSHAVGGSVWTLDPSSSRWTEITPEKPGGSNDAFGYSGIDIDPAHPGTILVSTLDRWHEGDDIFLTRDGGAHWMRLGHQSRHDASAHPWLVNYLGGQDRMGHWISDLRINPFDPEEMVYGTGYGLWMTHNLSAAGSGKPVNFDFAVTNLEETAVMQLVSPVAGAAILAAMGDVGGGGWTDVREAPRDALFVPMHETNVSVDYAGLAPAFIARAASSAPTHAFLSGDGGRSWAPVRSTPHKPKDVQGNWRSPGVIAVSAGASYMVWAPERDEAWWSGDKGKSWTRSIGWPAVRDRKLVPVSDKAAEGVFYVYSPGEGRLLASVDGGKSFGVITSQLPRLEGWQQARLAVVPGRFRDLWLAGPYGLLHSASADAPLAGVKGVQEAWSLGFGKAAPGRTYPAIYLWGRIRNQEGIWRSDDEGKAWTRINDAAHQFGGIGDIAGDMREFGIVYVAGGGRGVLVGRPAG